MSTRTRGRSETGGPRRATLLAVAYAVLGVLPLFLVSAQAVTLERDLGFGTAALGAAVSIGFVASALAAPLLSRLVERIGPRAGLRLAASCSLAALLLMALVASRWAHVALALALSGVANAAAQVSTNIVLASGVPHSRQGVAFGAKQAAIPGASLIAGVALPVVGLLAGWRAAFAAGAVVAAVAAAAVPPVAGATVTHRRPAGRAATPLLVTIAASGMLAGAVGTTLPTFTVDSAAARGIAESAAGIVLAAGSAAAILSRVGAGWIADRRGSSGLTELASLMALGALACVLLAVAADNRLLFVVAIVTGLAAGWGWPGIIYFAAVRAHPTAPAGATGLVLSAVYAGNMLGPATFGYIAEHSSYAVAWAAAAVIMACAALAALAARRRDRRPLEPRLQDAPAA